MVQRRFGTMVQVLDEQSLRAFSGIFGRIPDAGTSQTRSPGASCNGGRQPLEARHGVASRRNSHSIGRLEDLRRPILEAVSRS